jgi:hypothetical protein
MMSRQVFMEGILYRTNRGSIAKLAISWRRHNLVTTPQKTLEKSYNIAPGQSKLLLIYKK